MRNKKNNNKMYIQAVKYYEEGKIDKALKKCEESISENLKNSSTLNLKGLLLYLKGDLRGAVATWKINADFNDNDIAKNYVQDSKADNEKIRIYKEAEVLIAKQNIKDAIEKLKKCKQSDFNAIKVNLSLAICYMKIGQYEYSAAHLTRVLNIDRNNQSAKKVAKELQKVSDVKLQILNSSGKVFLKVLETAVVIGGCAVLIFGIYIGGTRIYNNFINKENNQIVENINDNSENTESENNSEQDAQTKNEIIVDADNLQKLIDSKDYNKIFDVLKDIDVDKLEGRQLAVSKLAVELLENEGAEYFYNQAMDYYKKSDYKNAEVELEKAYKYSSKTYLSSEILFFDGAVNDKNKNSDRAIKLYEEYYSKYKTGEYFNEILYNLAMLYKTQDLSKAKSYAKELNEDHPESMYNNENIKSLLNN